jgi:hypothetical protein
MPLRVTGDGRRLGPRRWRPRRSLEDRTSKPRQRSPPAMSEPIDPSTGPPRPFRGRTRLRRPFGRRGDCVCAAYGLAIAFSDVGPSGHLLSRATEPAGLLSADRPGHAAEIGHLRNRFVVLCARPEEQPDHTPTFAGRVRAAGWHTAAITDIQSWARVEQKTRSRGIARCRGMSPRQGGSPQPGCRCGFQ